MTQASRCPACDAAVGADTADLWGYTLSVCGRCGLWFWPRRDAADYEAVYETPEYEEVQTASLEAMTDPAEFVRHPTYASFFGRVSPAGGGARLLDVGCGVGRFLRAAKAVGWDVRGIDVSRKAVEVGGRTADFPMSCETLDDLRGAGARFDVVTAFEVLEHLEQPVEMLRSVRAVLSPGGRFFCTVPNRESPTVMGTRRQDWLPPVHLQFFTAGALRRVLERAGFRGVRTGRVWADPWPPLRPGSARPWLAYAARRALGRVRPDPLGLWAVGAAADPAVRGAAAAVEAAAAGIAAAAREE